VWSKEDPGSESAWLKALYKQLNVCAKKFTLVSGSALVVYAVDEQYTVRSFGIHDLGRLEHEAKEEALPAG
jgi:hypothetical protein